MKKKGFISVRQNKRRTMQTGGGYTELITSILLKDLRGVQANIANLPSNEKNAEAKPNRAVPYAEGRTALYLACRLPIPNPGIVKLLLANRFSPNIRNNVDATLGNGAYPLHGVVESIKDTIEKKAAPNFEQSLEIIQLLKANGADFGLKNSHGLTAYDEYVAYVKSTTSKSFNKDSELDTALKPPPPGPPSTPVLPPGPPSTPVLMPPRGRRQYSGVPTGPLPQSYAPPTGSHGQAPSGITIQPTQSLDVISGHSWPIENKNPPPVYSSRNATGIDPINAFVLCPTRIEEAFRSLLGNKCINMTLQYSQRPITLPASIADFNGKHLQVLARNESVNTTGVMKTSLYGGVLTVKEIATIRCLVKNTTVVGITYPERIGGYPQGSLIEPITRKPTIIVDQCGLQWQNSIYNTGALFFYPRGDDWTVVFQGTDQTDNQFTHTTLGEYRKWQNDTYFIMYGSHRPPVDLAADPDATWTANGQNIRGNLKSPVLGFKTEFMQAFDSVRFMADRTPSIKEVHFKFLRAGLGFFSENILLTGDTAGYNKAPKRTKFLETARLQGICEGISQLGDGRVVAYMDGAPAIMAHTKIKRIILPFQTVKIPQMDSINMYLLTSEEDALAQYQHPQYPHLDVTIATTNCADPHAGPGNEGRYESVDAAIASNTYVHHLNAAFNYANIQSKTFEEIGPVVPGAAAYPPPAYPPPAYPHSPAAAAAVYSPAFPPGGAAAVRPVRQNQPDIRVQQAPGSSKWTSAPQNVQALWPRYLLYPAGPTGFNHEHSSDHIMFNPNSNRVMFRHWDPTKHITLETGIMDVNDIKVYLTGLSLPPNKPNMVPGWYPALDYQIFAYLDFMYNTDQPQQSGGVTYFASANTDNELRTHPLYRAIKNFDETTLNTQPNTQPVIFTMRLLNGRICYQKNDAGRTQVMISGIQLERETYTQEMAAPSEAQLPGSPLPMAAPMTVAAPMRPIPPPPDSPRGQRGCFGAYCANNFPNFNSYMLTKHPIASRRLGLGGKNKNRKQQKLQKQQKQRATRKHKNKKQSRRRGQRQPRHIRGRGSRKSS